MSDSNSNALLITPEATLASALEGVLPDSIAVDRVGSVDDALARLDQSPFEVLLVDLGSSADEALSQLLERAGETPVIAITDAQHAALGVQAVRAGAQDFLRNPFDPDEVLYVVGKSLKSAALHADEPPPSLLLTPETPILGTSRAMQELRATLAKAADGVATVLVRGESGSGKELVARQLHELSPRRQGPFVKVHSGALPDNLLESELFGYEKGAFTGATAYKPGRLDLAAGGTLFLDEIGDISPAVQVKLLRVLQDREYERLGGTRTLEADVRFVAATHRDLETLVREGKFREDLVLSLERRVVVGSAAARAHGRHRDAGASLLPGPRRRQRQERRAARRGGARAPQGAQVAGKRAPALQLHRATGGPGERSTHPCRGRAA